MNKLLGLLLCAFALGACSNMSGTRSMGNTSATPSTTRSASPSANPNETKNSTDANKAGNPAAVSPAAGSK
jgi:hypothetical protein